MKVGAGHETSDRHTPFVLSCDSYTSLLCHVTDTHLFVLSCDSRSVMLLSCDSHVTATPPCSVKVAVMWQILTSHHEAPSSEVLSCWGRLRHLKNSWQSWSLGQRGAAKNSHNSCKTDLVVVYPPSAGDNSSIPSRAVAHGHETSLIECFRRDGVFLVAVLHDNTGSPVDVSMHIHVTCRSGHNPSLDTDTMSSHPPYPVFHT